MDRENIFRINDLFSWCARRALAFAVLSNGYEPASRHKVHFEAKGVFEEVAFRDHLPAHPAHASLSGGNPALTEHPTDDG